MAILITVALLLATATALAILRAVRPRFRFSWLMAIAATIAAWLSVFLWLPGLPLTLAVPLWQSASSPNSFATFAVSGQTWLYALCLVTLALAVLLTAPARTSFPNPSNWAMCLAMAGLGILAVSADSPLTLVLLWAGLDLAEAGIVLAWSENRSSSGQVAFASALRLGSIAVVLLALVLGDTSTTTTQFGVIQGPAAVLLPGAALLRLIAFAVPWPRSLNSSGLDEVGTTLHLVAGTAALAFLSQLTPQAPNDPGILLVLCAAAGLYAGWMWLRAPDGHSGRPLWIMGTGCLAVAAALRGNPDGTTGWGSYMLLAGSALLLTATQERRLNRVLYAALWIGSGLSFSLTAAAWLGASTSDWILPVLLVTQAMLLAGFVAQAQRPVTEPGRPFETAPLKGLYYAGIGLPLTVGILLGIWGWPGASQVGIPIASAVVIPVAAALMWAKRRFPVLTPVATQWIPGAWHAASTLIGREGARFHAGLQRSVEAVTRTIEGEAGIMWSLLLLVLFVSIIAGRQR